nr:hypothetical 1.5K protein - hepatitis C virus [Hepacivirus hominis]
MSVVQPPGPPLPGEP